MLNQQEFEKVPATQVNRVYNKVTAALFPGARSTRTLNQDVHTDGLVFGEVLLMLTAQLMTALVNEEESKEACQL